MAEYDPTLQGSAWGEAEGYEVADGDQQDNIQHSTQQDQAEYSISLAHDAPGDGSSHDGPAEDVGDYDPASINSAPEPSHKNTERTAPLKPSPQPGAKKPRTAGGFLVGDSDSEDDDNAPVPGSSGHPPGPTSHSSSAPHPTLQHNTAAQDSVGASNAPPAYQVKRATVVPEDNLGNGAAVSPPAPLAAAGSSPQPPPDRIAFLEDRVREGPRGALNHWLALIQEYRARNDVEASRQIYDRFLVVFPQAVSSARISPALL